MLGKPRHDLRRDHGLDDVYQRDEVQFLRTSVLQADAGSDTKIFVGETASSPSTAISATQGCAMSRWSLRISASTMITSPPGLKKAKGAWHVDALFRPS